jgi:hypothetical protein
MHAGQHEILPLTFLSPGNAAFLLSFHLPQLAELQIPFERKDANELGCTATYSLNNPHIQEFIGSNNIVLFNN